MTNKVVVIINSLKLSKIKKILQYEMKFLVPNYSCPQNPWLGGYRHPDPRSLCPLSSIEFVEPPPPLRTKFLGTPLNITMSPITNTRMTGAGIIFKTVAKLHEDEVLKLFFWVKTTCNPVRGCQWIGEKWRSQVSGLPTCRRIIVTKSRKTLL